MVSVDVGEWFKGTHQKKDGVRIGYFETQNPKTEFGIHEFLKINDK